ncbi:MAG: ParA family protein, partial [Phenylobacterium sp.]
MYDANLPTPARRPRVLSLANQKGGVGKTTTTINLGTALAACGMRVLIIDSDPQGNASTGLGIPQSARGIGTYDLLFGDDVTVEEIAVETGVPGLSVVTAAVDLSGAEVELVNVDRREYRLKDAIARSLAPFDYILIDCPPALGLLTLNALAASDAVL